LTSVKGIKATSQVKGHRVDQSDCSFVIGEDVIKIIFIDLSLPESCVCEVLIAAIFFRSWHVNFASNFVLRLGINEVTRRREQALFLLVIILIKSSIFCLLAEATHLGVEGVKSAHDALHVVFKLLRLVFIREFVSVLSSTKSHLVLLV